jgi:hypothetical protein
VEINFIAINPPDGDKESDSLRLQIYDSPDFEYGIDQITHGLRPSFSCNFPCATCARTNPNQCKSCATGWYDPKYLQESRNGDKTCKVECDDGYTYDAKAEVKKCLMCDISCLTCQSGNGIED